MKQFGMTITMGKRLIGKAMAVHADIKSVLEKGRLVIIAGTTNGYVAEEILGLLDQTEGFSRMGFRRGMTIAPKAKAPQAEFPGDVVLIDGKWDKGKTIFDVVDDLKSGDVILKGANALDGRGQAAIQIAHPKGGTFTALLTAVIGRRVQLIVPIGLEKRVFGNVNDLALKCNAKGNKGLRLVPVPGRTFTELDAIELLTGTEACLLAAGGIHGAEGSIWIGVSGTEEQIETAAELIKSVSDEPPCVV